MLLHIMPAPTDSYRFLLLDDADTESDTFYYDTEKMNLDIIATDELIQWSSDHDIIYELSYSYTYIDGYVDYDVKLHFNLEADLIIFALSWPL